jgi:hypothetical protein
MAFREPPHKYARMTLSIVVALLAVILAGIAFRRCLRQTRDLRGAGEAVREVRHPHSSQRKSGAGHRGVATRPVGRPSHNPVVWYKSFLYQAASWSTARRVVAKVEFHFGELFPRVGFIVASLEADSRAVVRFYNKRGTAEQWIKEGCQRHMRMPYLCQVEMWIKEGKPAVKMTRLSCHRFRSNEVRLWLSVIAYNLGNLWRRLVLPKKIDT